MPSDILHSSGRFYVIKSPKKGFEIYENGTTAAKRVASIGYEGEDGWQRVKAEIERRSKLPRRI